MPVTCRAPRRAAYRRARTDAGLPGAVANGASIKRRRACTRPDPCACVQLYRTPENPTVETDSVAGHIGFEVRRETGKE
jgi:hypothetical protein